MALPVGAMCDAVTDGEMLCNTFLQLIPQFVQYWKSGIVQQFFHSVTELWGGLKLPH